MKIYLINIFPLRKKKHLNINIFIKKLIFSQIIKAAGDIIIHGRGINSYNNSA